MARWIPELQLGCRPRHARRTLSAPLKKGGRKSQWSDLEKNLRFTSVSSARPCSGASFVAASCKLRRDALPVFCQMLCGPPCDGLGGERRVSGAAGSHHGCAENAEIRRFV